MASPRVSPWGGDPRRLPSPTAPPQPVHLSPAALPSPPPAALEGSARQRSTPPRSINATLFGFLQPYRGARGRRSPAGDSRRRAGEGDWLSVGSHGHGAREHYANEKSPAPLVSSARRQSLSLPGAGRFQRAFKQVAVQQGMLLRRRQRMLDLVTAVGCEFHADCDVAVGPGDGANCLPPRGESPIGSGSMLSPRVALPKVRQVPAGERTPRARQHALSPYGGAPQARPCALLSSFGASQIDTAAATVGRSLDCSDGRINALFPEEDDVAAQNPSRTCASRAGRRSSAESAASTLDVPETGAAAALARGGG